jgi:hypothetical protein
MNLIFRNTRVMLALVALIGACMQSVCATPQTASFTYQGQLQQNGQPANGTFDLSFALFDASTAGAQQSGTTSFTGFAVSGGLFTVSLSYPSATNGTQLWLEVTVDGNTMSPRTRVTTVPVAQYALSGAIANGSITTAMLATDSVTRSKLAGGAASGNVTLTLGAGTCGAANFSVPGAQVGDMAIISFNGITPPSQLMFAPLSVTAAGTVQGRICNVTGSAYSNANIPILIQTLR